MERAVQEDSMLSKERYILLLITPLVHCPKQKLTSNEIKKN